MTRTRVLVVGGGFAGVQCATELCKAARHAPIDIFLFNAENHLVFSPLLAEVVGSSINPLDVVVPLRQLLPEIHCRTEEGKRIDPAGNNFEFLADDGKPASMTYDHLVLACGNVTNLSVVPGMADHALPLKTVGDAAALRSHVMEQMEKAEVCPDPARKKWYLTFLIVGGGFSGVEVAGEINDLVRSSACYFRNFRCEDVSVNLIHSRDQILPEISPPLRDFARKKMEKAGVKFTLNARVALATPEGVGLQGGEFLKGATIVCTVGNATAPIIEQLALPKEKGRLLTQPDMRVRGSNNIWAIGDCGMIVNELDGQPSPTTGQFAERQGTQCAKNILRLIKNEPTQPFRFKQLGELCSIGGHSAVADIFGIHLSGFLAWFVWRGVYLFKLPTWGRRLQVGFDWAWLLLFPRDLAHIRTRQTDRVSQAHYQPGDVIIQPSDPPTNFYVIKNGEVEVSRVTSKDPGGEVVAVLGPGSFFGEKALLSNEPRVSTVRARTAVDVLVMGKKVFSQVSGALEPLKEALAKALNRRGLDIWQGRSQVRALLERTTIKEVMEGVPKPVLGPEATLHDVSHAFVECPNEIFYLAGEGQILEGVITMSDLLRARSGGAVSTTPAREFMSANPVALAADDSCAVAAEAMREYRLKSLPVVEKKENRKVIGTIRARQLMAYVIKHSAGEQKTAEQAPK